MRNGVLQTGDAHYAPPRDIVSTLTGFARALRQRGLLVTPAEAVTATRSLGLVDISDRRELYLALRSVFTSQPQDYAVFDELFAAWWDVAPNERGERQLPGPKLDRLVRGSVTAPLQSTASLQRWGQTGDADGEPFLVPGKSDRDSAVARDFSAYVGDELGEITRIARRIARRLARRPSRRWQFAGTRGGRVDMRRTVRRSLATGGDAAALLFRQRKPRKTRLTALCDVSGSMDIYGGFLLQFLYALQNSFARVETFAFSTRLRRITDELQTGSYRDALAQLARGGRGWSGGTRIGASLAEFSADWLGTVDRRTIVIILSDGWDTGEPEILSDAMREIRARAGKVIWLNPLLGNPSYQPLTRGMQAALPHVDIFAPVHNLASLEQLGSLLSL
ncbi:MAG: VWA domain-containing protein [Anaerolineae bacterium]|nr:VWA domain-containing protein [Gemmatimonadaceae bacterium]